MTKIPPSDRLIVALDVSNQNQALELVDKLNDQVSFFKVGLELFSSGQGISLIEELSSRGLRIFADFKFHDIPQTVYRAVRNLNGLGIEFLTVHCYPGVIEAAVDACEDISILGVTVLTSVSEEDLKRSGYNASVSQAVVMRATQAYDNGCTGVVASGQEARVIRNHLGTDIVIVTPGIRLDEGDSGDQKRIASVEQALQMGSDYLVVGRPIRDAVAPDVAAQEIQHKIRNTLAS